MQGGQGLPAPTPPSQHFGAFAGAELSRAPPPRPEPEGAFVGGSARQESRLQGWGWRPRPGPVSTLWGLSVLPCCDLATISALLLTGGGDQTIFPTGPILGRTLLAASPPPTISPNPRKPPAHDAAGRLPRGPWRRQPWPGIPKVPQIPALQLQEARGSPGTPSKCIPANTFRLQGAHWARAGRGHHLGLGP